MAANALSDFVNGRPEQPAHHSYASFLHFVWYGGKEYNILQRAQEAIELEQQCHEISWKVLYLARENHSQIWAFFQCLCLPS